MVNRVLSIHILFLFLFLSGCGGGGTTGSTVGTTVTLQAQVTQGKPTVVFSNFTSISSRNSFTPMMDFTLRSTVNSNAGSMASNVSIESETVSYEFIEATPPINGVTFAVPPLIYASNLAVPAGGSADWQNVPIMSLAQKDYLKTAIFTTYSTATREFRSYPGGGQIKFQAKINFSGTETKNGSHISVGTTGTVILVP